ncbi:MAG: hypothetical protein IPH08_16995 [Rhodocyclaceae bacterium]|nr:hypothetical protein [Rhodocyclaceae bacterium]
MSLRVTVAELRASGREPLAPAMLDLPSGEFHLQEWLRVLPGKRLTGRGLREGRPALLKLFIAERGSERHWRRECEGLELLRAATLPTPALLEAGQHPEKSYYLLTEFLTGAASPPIAVSPAPTWVFALLGRLHAAGLVQEDAHFDNFLRRGDEVFLIDGAALRRSRSDADKADNLAVLLAQLPAQLSEAVRDELLVAYRTTSPGALDVAAVLTRCEAVRERRLADYLDKCLRDCTLFQVERSSSRFTAVVRTEAETLAPLLADLDGAMAIGVPLKQGGTATVAQVSVAGRTLVIKRYNIKNRTHALSRCWRPSRAWHSWLAGHRLRFLGVATPAPLALVEERRGPLRGRAWLITEHCPGTPLLQRWQANAMPPDDELAALDRLLGQLSRWKLAHGDFKANNLLWAAPDIALIDLDAMHRHQRAATFRRAHARDLTRLLRNWPEQSLLRLALQARFQVP